MVRNEIAKKFEPEQRNLREYVSLVRDAGGQHVVKGRDAVGGYEQQASAPRRYTSRTFPLGMEFEVGKVSTQKNGVEK